MIATSTSGSGTERTFPAVAACLLLRATADDIYFNDFALGPKPDVGVIRGSPVTVDSRPAKSQREACFKEAIGERGEVFRPPKRCQISQIGGAQIGIAFERPRHGPMCWLKPPGERITGC
jgi:hypothetical protein